MVILSGSTDTISVHSRLPSHLVRVEDFAGERVVPQRAGGTGAAVVQSFSAVPQALLVLSVQICCALYRRPDTVRLQVTEGRIPVQTQSKTSQVTEGRNTH